jgi:hypothetical protein
MVAERVGFEPTLEFPLNTLSKRAPSTTRPSLHLETSLRVYQRGLHIGFGEVLDGFSPYFEGEMKAFTLLRTVLYSLLLPAGRLNLV